MKVVRNNRRGPLRTKIRLAIRYQHPIQISYLKLGNGERVTRVLEPHRVFRSKPGEYLVVGMDRMREDVRSFRLSNVLAIETLTDEGFILPWVYDREKVANA